MAWIGADHRAGFLAAIERHRIKALFFKPKIAVKTSFDLLRPVFEIVLRRFLPQETRKAGHSQVSAEDIPLSLDEGDRRLGKGSVGMEHRIMGVLPTLVGESLLRSLGIFDIAVLVQVPKISDPLQGRQGVGKELSRQRKVGGPFDIPGEEDQKEGGRIDAAKIRDEWDFL